MELLYPQHAIHEMFKRHAASNTALSEGIETDSVVSSLNGLERSFQQLGRLQFDQEAHIKTEPEPM